MILIADRYRSADDNDDFFDEDDLLHRYDLVDERYANRNDNIFADYFRYGFSDDWW